MNSNHNGTKARVGAAQISHEGVGGQMKICVRSYFMLRSTWHFVFITPSRRRWRCMVLGDTSGAREVNYAMWRVGRGFGSSCLCGDDDGGGGDCNGGGRRRWWQCGKFHLIIHANATATKSVSNAINHRHCRRSARIVSERRGVRVNYRSVYKKWRGFIVDSMTHKWEREWGWGNTCI